MNYKGITLILTAAMVISGGNYVLVKGSTLDSGKNNSGYEIKVNNSESLSSLGEYKDINLESSNASNITYDLEKYKNKNKIPLTPHKANWQNKKKRRRVKGNMFYQ